MTQEVFREGEDGGFTLMETMVVLLVMSIVACICLFGLTSLSNTASRSDAMVQEEQTASTVLAQLTEDLRSAVTISFPSGASPSSEIELTEVGTSACTPATTTTTAAGGVTYKDVLWVVSSTTGTLTREQQNASCTFVQSPLQLNYLVNTASEPVFSYTDDQGKSVPFTSPAATTPLDPSWGATIARQASGVNINLYVSTVIRGVASFHTTSVVALTNQLQTLNAAGQGT